MPSRNLLLAGALALAAGCADPEERPTTDFAYLHATIIEPNCATSGCHSNSTQQGPLMPDGTPNVCSHFLQVPIDLSTPAAACKALTNNPTQYLGAPIGPYFSSIVPSVLAGDDHGNDSCPNPYAQMPPDVPLPDGEIRLLDAWVAEGVPCNE